MISNVELRETLTGLARSKFRDFETTTVVAALVPSMIENGWVVSKRNDKSIQLKKNKSHGVYFEDRVWLLMYRMGFIYLSGKGGAKLKVDPKTEAGPYTNIDVVALDDEVAIAIECKSSLVRSKRPQFAEELGKHALIRQRFATAINQQFSSESSQVKRHSLLVMFLENTVLTDNDRKRASEVGIFLFDSDDLEY